MHDDLADYAQIAVILVQMFVVPALLYLLIVLDESRLPEAARARAWPQSTRLVATFAFSIVALPIHIARTRRGAKGFLLALSAFVVSVLVLAILPEYLLDWFD